MMTSPSREQVESALAKQILVVDRATRTLAAEQVKLQDLVLAYVNVVQSALSE